MTIDADEPMTSHQLGRLLLALPDLPVGVEDFSTYEDAINGLSVYKGRVLLDHSEWRLIEPVEDKV